jgi:putative ABC transport system permease protein
MIVRDALRRLFAHPVQTATMALTLAVGIGAATAVFSVADQTILRAAPYAYASRLVDVLHFDPRSGGGGNTLTPATIAGWQRQPAVFERFEGYAPRQFDVTGGEEPERISGLIVSTGLFDMLGVQPRLGRSFRDEDGHPGADRVVIVSDTWWQRRLGASADVLGRRILLNGDAYTVIGVMPRFRLLRDDAAWIPIDVNASADQSASMSTFYGLGRLPPGLSVAAAQRLSESTADQLDRISPLPRGWHLRLTEKRVARVSATTRTVMFLLLGAVAFVLLISCANVANLFLSRAAARQRDVAIRSALGASRARLLCDTLVESLAIAAIGGAAGLWLSTWGVSVIVAAAPENFAFMTTTDIRVDGRVIVAAAIATLASGLLFGLIPAVRGSRPDLDRTLRACGAAGAQAIAHAALPGLLVVGEIAFSVVLLVGAALMVRSLTNLEAIDPGFDPKGLLAFHVDLPSDRYPTVESRVAFFANLERGLRDVRGITDMSVAWGVPPTLGGFSVATVEVEGADAGNRPAVLIPNNTVDSAYFRTLRMPFVEGRTFRDEDGAAAVVISQAFAEAYWPGQSAVGRRFRLGLRSSEWKTVVGVVANVETRSAGEARAPMQMYVPWATRTAPDPPAAANAARRPQRTYAARLVVVRGERPIELLPAIKARIWAIDRDQPIERIALVEDVYQRAFGRERFVLVLMSVFGGIAVVLAAAGIFAVLSQIVAQRTREIGIRIALGATPADVVRLVVGRGMLLALSGSALGIAGAAALTRLLRSVLFEVSPYDPASFIAVLAALGIVAFLACWLPARRAMGIDPAQTFRAE